MHHAIIVKSNILAFSTMVEIQTKTKTQLFYHLYNLKFLAFELLFNNLILYLSRILYI